MYVCVHPYKCESLSPTPWHNKLDNTISHFLFLFCATLTGWLLHFCWWCNVGWWLFTGWLYFLFLLHKHCAITGSFFINTAQAFFAQAFAMVGWWIVFVFCLHYFYCLLHWLLFAFSSKRFVFSLVFLILLWQLRQARVWLLFSRMFLTLLETSSYVSVLF